VSIVVRFNPTSLTREQYDEVITRLQAQGDFPPEGLSYHIFFGPDDALKVSEVWDSHEQFEAFAPRLMPILEAVGIQFAGPPEALPVHAVIQRPHAYS
jgi:hypothetical protein